MDTHSFVGAFTKIHRAHSFEFGAEFRSYRHNRYNVSTVMSGSYQFDQTYTRGPLDNSAASPFVQGMASFLLGIANTNSYIERRSDFAEQSTAWAFYIQDNWRLTRKLNVTLGLRYELETPLRERYNRSVSGFNYDTTLAESAPAEAAYAANYSKNPFPELPPEKFKVRGGLLFAGVSGNSADLWQKDSNNFMPRIGFAYSWADKTVIRGGYGIYFGFLGARRTDVNQIGFARQTKYAPTSDSGLTFKAKLDNPFPDGLLPPQGSSAGVETELGNDISFFNPKPLAPLMQRWQFSIQHELPLKTVVEFAYIGNVGSCR